MSEIREYRFGQIWDCVQQGREGGVTMSKIAEYLKCKRAPWLIQMVNELVKAGHIYAVPERVQTGRGLRVALVYRICEVSE